MIETLTQPVARLDLSRSVTLLDPSAERRNRRWTSQLAEEETELEELARGERLAAEAPARERHAAPPNPGGLERALPQGGARRPVLSAFSDLPRPEASAEISGSESPPHDAAIAPVPPNPTGPRGQGDSDPEVERPHLPPPGSLLAKVAVDAPPAAVEQGPRRQDAGKTASPLSMAGFPEACIEQPAGKGSGVGRAAEAGFPKAAPGQDLALSRGVAAGRTGGAAREGAEAVGAALTPVQILSKPVPRYPEEALRRRVQGDVLVDVEFRYSGAVEVLGVRRGLGHGLNESAIEAARGISFAPARRDGRPVDTPATLRIRFQLLH